MKGTIRNRVTRYWSGHAHSDAVLGCVSHIGTTLLVSWRITTYHRRPGPMLSFWEIVRVSISEGLLKSWEFQKVPHGASMHNLIGHGRCTAHTGHHGDARLRSAHVWKGWSYGRSDNYGQRMVTLLCGTLWTICISIQRILLPELYPISWISMASDIARLARRGVRF